MSLGKGSFCLGARQCGEPSCPIIVLGVLESRRAVEGKVMHVGVSILDAVGPDDETPPNGLLSPW